MSKYIEAARIALDYRDTKANRMDEQSRRSAKRWHDMIVALYMLEAREGWNVIDRVVKLDRKQKEWCDQWR